MQSGYIPSLDGFRAVSIIIVFLSHVGFGHIVPGGFGVTVFFFLSGFLITTLLIKEHDTHGSVAIRAFYMRRVVRLAPPLLLTLLFSAVLVGGGLAEGGLSPWTFLSQIFFFFNYFGLYAGADSSVDGLGILWSLSVEEHFYLFYPFVFVLFARGTIGLRSVVILTLGVTVWRFVCYGAFGLSEWEIYTRTDTRIDSMLYGCLLALLMGDGKATAVFTERRMYAIIPVALAVIVLTFLMRDEMFRSTIRYTLQGISLMPIFFYAVCYSKRAVFAPLNWAWVRQIGKYSYTLYLVHFVIIKSLVSNGFGEFHIAALVAASAGLSLLYSALVYEFAEKPFAPFRKRLSGH